MKALLLSSSLLMTTCFLYADEARLPGSPTEMSSVELAKIEARVDDVTDAFSDEDHEQLRKEISNIRNKLISSYGKSVPDLLCKQSAYRECFSETQEECLVGLENIIPKCADDYAQLASGLTDMKDVLVHGAQIVNCGIVSHLELTQGSYDAKVNCLNNMTIDTSVW